MKLPVASFSLLNRWENCRWQVYRMYIARDLPRGSGGESKEQHYGNEVHDAFARRIRDKIPFPEKLKHFEKWTAPLDHYKIEPEMRIAITQGGELHDGYDGSWLFTKIDCPVIGDDETTAMLTDWKSGGSVREEPLELNIQALCLKAKFPKLQKIIGHYAWLKFDQIGLPHDCSNVARTWAIVNVHMRDIKQAIEHHNFPKSPGPLCRFCPVHDCEHNRVKK